MRLGKDGFRAPVKGKLHLEFGEERLTSYSGLELFRRFLLRMGIMQHLRGLGQRLRFRGDFPAGNFVLLILGMLLVGARRLRHVRYLRNDPMLCRFAELKRLPDERTLSRMLKKFSSKSWEELDRINTLVVDSSLKACNLKRITLDLDGSVLSTGLQVERAFRGFNPHHRKNPSYYPIMANIAQTGQILGHRNRSGNVHDSTGSGAFLRQNVNRLREDMGFSGDIECRTDSAFFVRPFLETCVRYGVEYAIKVPMWPWLNLKKIIQDTNEQDWECVESKGNVQGFFVELEIECWDRKENLAIFRKRVNHKPAKGVQLDLFEPNDGYWEYSVVATNKKLGLKPLYRFMNGRGVQEKTFAELKDGFAFDAIPTNAYGANTAWQKLNILTHNIAVAYQLSTTATVKPRTLKRTTAFLIKSIRTLRFTWLNQAGRFCRPGGRNVVRLSSNPQVEKEVRKMEDSLCRQAA